MKSKSKIFEKKKTREITSSLTEICSGHNSNVWVFNKCNVFDIFGELFAISFNWRIKYSAAFIQGSTIAHINLKYFLFVRKICSTNMKKMQYTYMYRNKFSTQFGQWWLVFQWLFDFFYVFWSSDNLEIVFVLSFRPILKQFG